ncbi:MAG: hypothetical protein HYS40_00645 [Gemmatimonadetes bacterium]|nr:hypothetical protein [Gemmatimonadota bacterium]
MSRNGLPWIAAGAAVAGLVAVLAVTLTGGAAHPDPRPGIGADLVLPPATIPPTPGALEAYAAARGAPQLVDGLYCHCQCQENLRHRSLLTCFASDHGAYCDICMGEAMLAVRLAGQGQSLQDIRRAIDRQWGS